MPEQKMKDVEDGDCWFEGIWKGNDSYLVTRVFWNGIYYDTPEEDDAIGKVIKTRWYYLELM